MGTYTSQYNRHLEYLLPLLFPNSFKVFWFSLNRENCVRERHRCQKRKQNTTTSSSDNGRHVLRTRQTYTLSFLLDSIISNRPKVGRMRIIFGPQFNGTHIVLRIVNGCISGKSNTFSKLLVPPHTAIMGHMF